MENHASAVYFLQNDCAKAQVPVSKQQVDAVMGAFRLTRDEFGVQRTRQGSNRAWAGKPGLHTAEA